MKQENKPLETPLHNLRLQALVHYDEAATAISHYSSFVKDAILNYDPNNKEFEEYKQILIKRIQNEIVMKKIEDDLPIKLHNMGWNTALNKIIDIINE